MRRLKEICYITAAFLPFKKKKKVIHLVCKNAIKYNLVLITNFKRTT